MKIFKITIISLTIIFVLIACSNNSKSGFDYKNYQQIGELEDEVRIAAIDGYIQDGKDDKNTNWVNNFVKATGCSVKISNAESEQEIINKVELGKIDGFLARSNVVNEALDKGLIAPLNTSLITKYPQISDRLKGQPFNTYENQTYSIPASFGFQVLNYNSEKLKQIDSWETFFKPNKSTKNKIAVNDSIETLAQAALFLKADNPKLGITSPFSLSQEQLNAVLLLLKNQQKGGIKYFSDQMQLSNSLASQQSLLGNTDLNYSYTLRSENVPIDFSIPKEGTIGWVDSWAILKKAKNPNCMYKWIDHVTTSEINAQYAQFVGAAPANIESCSFITKSSHCKIYFAEDNPVLNQITFWTNPNKSCLDGRTGGECVTYTQFKSAWEKIISPI